MLFDLKGFGFGDFLLLRKPRELSNASDQKAQLSTSQQHTQSLLHMDRFCYCLIFLLFAEGCLNICNIFLQLLHLQGHGWRVVWVLCNKKEISWLGLILHLSWATGLQLCHQLSQVRWNWILLIFAALGSYLFIYNVYIFQNDLIWDATAWSIMDF